MTPTLPASGWGSSPHGIVRLVVDLKHPIRPTGVFSLAPVAAYQHRLVFDLYPVDEMDPLEAPDCRPG